MGTAIKFGDDISTDLITPGRYMHLRKDLTLLAQHTLEDADPTFVQRVRPGDFVVAGDNFGMGSSREHAPRVLQLCGVSAVIARSCARIFFRNAINVGLPVLICDTTAISDGDRLRVDLANAMLTNETTGAQIPLGRLPPVMLQILKEGGLKPFIQKYGSFAALAQEPSTGG